MSKTINGPIKTTRYYVNYIGMTLVKDLCDECIERYHNKFTPITKHEDQTNLEHRCGRSFCLTNGRRFPE